MSPVYLNVFSAIDEALGSPFLHQDLLIFPPQVDSALDVVSSSVYNFSIQLRFPHLSTFTEIKDKPQQNLRKVLIVIQDCFQTQKVQLLTFISGESFDEMMRDELPHDMASGKSANNENKTITKTTHLLSALSNILFAEESTTVPYLILFFAVVIFITVLIIIGTVNCLLQRQRKCRSRGIHLKYLHLKDSNNTEFIVVSSAKANHHGGGYIPLDIKLPQSPFRAKETTNQSLTCTMKGVLVSYISFRVFYTFLFTFSVALSILFSFWSPIGVENSRLIPTWSRDSLLPLNQREAVRHESDTEKLMDQHSIKAAQLVNACQDIMIRQIVDVVREVDRTVQHTLDAELNPRKSRENMFKLLEDVVFRQMNDFHLAVQDYITHLRAELDNSMMPDVVRFSELLSSIYASQWLLFIKRMMNSTHIPWDINASEVHFIPTPEHLNALRLKMSNIEFARQFGLAEAENFLFVPSLITSQ